MVPAGHIRPSAAPQWSKTMQRIDPSIMHALKSTSYVADFQFSCEADKKIILYVCPSLHAVPKYPINANGNE